MRPRNLKSKVRRIHMYNFRRKIVRAYFLIISAFSIILLFMNWGFKKLGISLYLFLNPAYAFFVIWVLCLILSSVTIYFLITQLFEPLKKISSALKKVSKGDYSIQLDYSGNIEEFQYTINNFNKMVRELDSVEMLRNDFIANVSHEFKTPLSSVTGYVTLLQDPELTESEKDEYIQKIFFNINKLNSLTENILLLSKLENQNTLPEPVTYRLDEQIREAIVLLEPRWSAKRIQLDIDLPELKWKGQRSLMLQVWINLISNAIKFSETGGEISVNLKRKNGSVRVTVSDNGIGMSEETQAHIFDKFYQGDTSRRSQGNGLGLALCSEILGRCGGKIYVRSESGEGSVFMVVLNE